MRAWLGREPQGRLPRVAFVKSPRGTGCAGRCLSLGCIDVRKTKLLSASFVSKELVAHAAARAGGGAIAGTRASFFLCAPELTQSWRIPAWTFPLPAPGWVRKGVFTHTRRPFPFSHLPLRTPQYLARCPRPNKPHVGQLVAEAKARSPTNPIDFTAAGGPIVSGQRWLRISTSAYSNPRPSSRIPNLAAPRHGGARHLRVMARLRVARSTI